MMIKKTISPLRLIITILWPFASFLYEFFNNPKSRFFSFTFLSFSVFIGLNGIVSYDTGTDFAGYVVGASQFKSYSLIEIFQGKDFFYPIISKILSNISTNNLFISCCFVLIFSLLYLNSFKIIIKQYQYGGKRLFNLLFLISVYCIIPFAYVNGFRFYTALLYLLWCLLEYIINNKKIYLLYIILTPFIHFSFLIFLPVLVLHLVLKNQLIITFTIFLITIVFSTTKIPDYINDFATVYLSEVVSNNVSIYASEEGLENMKNKYESIALESKFSRVIYKSTFNIMNKSLMYSTLILIILKFNYIKKNKLLINYFVIIMLSYSLANLTGSISNGFRFFVVANTIYIFLLFHLIFSNINWRYEFLTNLTIGKLLYFILFIIIISYAMMKIYFSQSSFNILNAFLGNWITNINTN